jgi:hypothetical protein
MGYIYHTLNEMEGLVPLRAARARSFWVPVFKKRLRKTGRPRLQDLSSGAPRFRRPWGGRFPFPREKGSEKGSYQTPAGVARKPDFFQKSG